MKNYPICLKCGQMVAGYYGDRYHKIEMLPNPVELERFVTRCTKPEPEFLMKARQQLDVTNDNGPEIA